MSLHCVLPALDKYSSIRHNLSNFIHCYAEDLLSFGFQAPPDFISEELIYSILVESIMSNNPSRSLLEIDGSVYKTDIDDDSLVCPFSVISELLAVPPQLEEATFLSMRATLELIFRREYKGSSLVLYETYKEASAVPSDDCGIPGSLSIHFRAKNTSVLLRSYEKSKLGILEYSQYLQKRCPSAYILSTKTEPLLKRANAIIDHLDNGCPKETASSIGDLASDISRIQKFVVSPNEFRMHLLELLLCRMAPIMMLEVDTAEGTCNATDNKIFRVLYKRGETSNSRFIGFFLIFNVNSGSHANFVVVDKSQRTAERFEPNGNTSLGGTGELVDSYLNAFFLEKEYKYVPPSAFEDEVGVQSIEHMFSSRTGFCVTWCFLYAEKRLSGTLSGISAQKAVESVMRDEIYAHRARHRSSRSWGEAIESSIISQITHIVSKIDRTALTDYMGHSLDMKLIDSELCLVAS